MAQFQRNLRDNLTTTPRTLLVAAVVVAMFFVALVVGYSAFH